MKSKLSFIKGNLIQKFPKNTDAIWASELLYDSLVPEHYSGASYARISCAEPLKEITLYCKLEKFATSSGENNIFISPTVLEKNQYIDEQTVVDIEFIDLDLMTEAESVVIKLHEDLVMTWSEDESEFAKQQYKTKNRLVHYHQKVLLQTGTHKSVWANVQKIFPQSERNQAFRITQNTGVTLEGLPESQQKVIDFEKIGGLDHLIQNIREIIQVPIVYPELLEKFKIQPPKGLLLYGPPGNGKTLIAKAIAYSLGAKFVSIEGPELESKYVGEGQKRLREKFEEASQYKNSVLFIDEIDAIARNRDHESTESYQIDTVATLLNLMDGLRSSKGLFVIGATNRPDSVDRALRRPGRFELEYEIGLPDEAARLDILKKTIPFCESSIVHDEIDEKFLNYLGEVTNGYSGADLVSLYRLSVIKAIRRNLIIKSETGRIEISRQTDTIRLQISDFQEILKEITPTSMRGLENRAVPIPWNELIIQKENKKELEFLHQWIEKAAKSEFISRMPFMNLLLAGKKHSGRETIMASFAKEFRYELIRFDLLDHFSETIDKLISQLEITMQKCKQVAPSILFIKNLEMHPDYDLIYTKLSYELEMINNKRSVLAVLSLNDEPDFETTISKFPDFEMIIKITSIEKESLQNLARKYHFDDEQLSLWEDLPLGKIVSKIEESIIRNS